MIKLSAAGRAGILDEVGAVVALLMGPDGTFITGSDFLMDGGVTAAYCTANSLRSDRRAAQAAIFNGTVDLNSPEALETLRDRRPEHYAKVQAILAIARGAP